MSSTFHAQDNAFAVATGSNVGSGDGTSTFDYPPTSSKDLVVTANDGDPSPGSFELGSTYDISFGGQGGSTIEDAVVVRSDYLGTEQGVIVFEGTDANGDLTQVVWTPNFDLEGWYFDNFSEGVSPGFYTTDQQAGYFEFVCFAPGTLIRTPDGPRPAGSLVAGDLVETLDRGPRPLIWVGSRRLRFPPSPDSQKPVQIRAGAFGGGRPSRDLVVSPQHRILVCAPEVAAIVGTHEALAPAKSVEPMDGVRIMHGKREVHYVSLLLDRHEILFAEDLPVESFLPGPWAMTLLDPAQRAEVARVMPRVLDGAAGGPVPPARPVLPVRKARALAARRALCVPAAPGGAPNGGRLARNRWIAEAASS